MVAHGRGAREGEALSSPLVKHVGPFQERSDKSWFRCCKCGATVPGSVADYLEDVGRLPPSALDIRALLDVDRSYALVTWREGHKKSPGVHRVPWSYYKHEYGHAFEKILDDPANRLIGAYAKGTGSTLPGREGMPELLGWLVMTPGKRVHTLHWIHTKHEHRRQGVMLALLAAADLNTRLVYTLRARRDRATLPDGSVSKSLDESLVIALRARGVSATHVPFKEWSA